MEQEVIFKNNYLHYQNHLRNLHVWRGLLGGGGGGGGGMLSPRYVKFLQYLIQTEIICDNILKFGQFVKICHFCTFEVQFFQFISIPSLKVKPVISYIQNGILTNH